MPIPFGVAQPWRPPLGGVHPKPHRRPPKFPEPAPAEEATAGTQRWIRVGHMKWISTYLGDASDEFSWHSSRQEERGKRLAHLRSQQVLPGDIPLEEKDNLSALPSPLPGDLDYADEVAIATDVAVTPPHRAPPERRSEQRPHAVPTRKAKMFTRPQRSAAPGSRRVMISPSTDGARRSRAHSKYLEMCTPPPPPSHRPSPNLVGQQHTCGVTAFELRLLEDPSRKRPGSPGAPLVIGGPLMPSSRASRESLTAIRRIERKQR